MDQHVFLEDIVIIFISVFWCLLKTLYSKLVYQFLFLILHKYYYTAFVINVLKVYYVKHRLKFKYCKFVMEITWN